MTAKKIHAAAAREAAKFDLAVKMRHLLDEHLKQYPAAERDDIESEISALVFEGDE